MLDLSEFESISPYTDEEAAEALTKLAEFPLLSQISQQFFPEESPEFLKKTGRRSSTGWDSCVIWPPAMTFVCAMRTKRVSTAIPPTGYASFWMLFPL